jgi:SPP1 gp7 family putative phage head morphogenesis protein
VKAIDAAYNKSYLEAEYNFAVQSSQMAAKWAEFERSGDRYNLQYRTANDDKVRESHRKLDGTTLPVSDPFWDKYLPPLSWNCRCTVVQVRRSKYAESNSEEAQEKGEAATTQIGADGTNRLSMFRFNPGKEKVVFPKVNAYTSSKCNHCDTFDADGSPEGLSGVFFKLSAKIPDSEK